MNWTEVKHTTVLGKDMGLIPLKYRLRYRYFEKPYGNGLRYSRRTRGWYKPFEKLHKLLTKFKMFETINRSSKRNARH